MKKKRKTLKTINKHNQQCARQTVVWQRVHDQSAPTTSVDRRRAPLPSTRAARDQVRSVRWPTHRLHANTRTLSTRFTVRFTSEFGNCDEKRRRNTPVRPLFANRLAKRAVSTSENVVACNFTSLWFVQHTHAIKQ